MRAAPFPPLVAGNEGLERRPASPDALRQRMAELYGVREAQVLVVRGALHGIELALRLAGRPVRVGGLDCSPEWTKLARIYDVEEGEPANATLRIVASPGNWGEPALDEAQAKQAAETAQMLVIDEGLIEFSEAPSLADFAARSGNVIVLRDLSFAYGLAGAPCGAMIASEVLIAGLAEVLEPDALAVPVVRVAQAALDPSRTLLNDARIAEVKAERARMREVLAGRVDAAAAEGPFVFLAAKDAAAAQAALRRVGAEADVRADGALRLVVAQAAANDRVLAALGASSKRAAPRLAEVVRETLETRIAVRVDLDAGPKAAIDSGVGYFDHMLAQVATHGGFSIALSCKGDLEVDAHHTIEDCALALGQALKQALGEKRGIARYGFLLPMDEAEAKVSIDLGGRPYSVFEGAFKAPLIGAYPTEMTEHVFRSLAQSMGAAIHVSVTGENDHHLTEACFKAFGRALRQAIRIEGSSTPSTKGVIA